MKEIILFLDYSVLPVSNDIILGDIDSAISIGCKIIFLDLGQYFPWSLDNIIKSDFSYSDKLVDRIASVCDQHDIILIPALSALIDGDYILNDNKYSSLKEDGYNNQGLNISSCGMNKLIEELIEDIFSLFTKTEYLFFELPAIMNKNEEWIKNIDSFVKRLSLYMRHQNKKLIFGDNLNLGNIIPDYLGNSLVEYYNNPVEKIEVLKGNTFSIFFNTYNLKLEHREYFLYKLKIYCVLPYVFDSALFLMNRNTDNNEKYRIDFEILDTFLSSLEQVWSLIRKSREFISILDRYPNNKYRIKFYRIIEELKHEFVLLKKHSKLIKNVFEQKYQPGFFNLWMNSRMDPVYIQLINLNLKARHIKEGR